MRKARTIRWHRAAAVVTALAAGALGVTAVSAGASSPAEPVDLSSRDAAMGSQIARHEGVGVSMRTLEAQSGDDPTGGIQGIDVSRWQGNVDWQYWWDQGKRFAYVKATEGTYNTSAYFDQQYNGSAQVGMRRGAYHFAIPSDSTGAAQANFFADNGGGWARDGKTLPGVVDLEYNPYADGTGSCYGKSKQAMVSWINDFIDTYKSRAGRFPVIYTSTNWWNLCVGSAAYGETSPLWIARWSSEVGALPGGWSNWTFWQYSDNPIDQDKFSGTSSQLQQLVDGPTPTAPASVTAKGGHRKATVTWQEPRWPGVDGVTKYRIDVSPGDRVIDDIPSTARSQVVTGLTSGTTYTFTIRAFSAEGPGATARKRLIGTRFATSLSPTTVKYGTTAKFSGRIYRADNGAAAVGLRAVLQRRKKGSSTWVSEQATKTGSTGGFGFTVKPWSHRDYRVVYNSGYTTYMASVSAARPVKVRQAVSGSFYDSTVRRGTTAKFRGKVSPNHAGKKIYLQRYSGGKWNTVLSRTLSSSSTYSFSFSRGTAGTVYYRAYAPGHYDHYSGRSPHRKLVVS